MRYGWLTLALVLGASPVSIGASARKAAVRPASADDRLKAIYTAEYTWRQKMQGSNENSPRGIQPNLPDVGPEAQAAKLARWTETERQLAAIRVADLTPWTRRNFARWMWEDYPRAILGTPDRWRRGAMTTPGAWST